MPGILEMGAEAATAALAAVGLGDSKDVTKTESESKAAHDGAEKSEVDGLTDETVEDFIRSRYSALGHEAAAPSKGTTQPKSVREEASEPSVDDRVDSSGQGSKREARASLAVDEEGTVDHGSRERSETDGERDLRQTAPGARTERSQNEDSTRPAPQLHFRRPGTNPEGFAAPPLEWLSGKWYFTHSTLPTWKDKRNVSISYEVKSSSAPSNSGTEEDLCGRLEDVVEFQDLKSDKVHAVKGQEHTDGDSKAWNWRGQGIIKIASSHWEVLGWGDGHADQQKGQRDGTGAARWMVTYFIKTAFTPAAIDIYARSAAGVGEDLLRSIKSGLTELGDGDISGLVEALYEVRRD